MSHAYRLCGVRVGSDIEMPELVVWDGPDDTPVGISVRYGDVPDALESPDHVGALFQTRGGREYLLRLPGVGRILVKDGCQVVIEPAAGCDAVDTRAFVTGPVQAMLWHQRGLLPLHASAVAVNGRAVAVAGHSGAGKSTLAAMLAAHGLPVLTDDVCVVDTPSDGPAQVLPGFPRLRLWRDSLDLLKIDPAGLPLALSGQQKFLIDRRDNFLASPLPLAAVFLLERENRPDIVTERVRGVAAVSRLADFVHARRPAAALGCGTQIFAAISRALSSGVAVWRLTVPKTKSALPDIVTRILAKAEE